MVSLRSCNICKKKLSKTELIKISLVLKDNEYIASLDSNNGRGIYVCKNAHCIDKWINNINKQKSKMKYKINKDSLLSVLNTIKSTLKENQ